VVLYSGKTALCSLQLVRGAGHCSPGESAFDVGDHSVFAEYIGDTNFTRSKSASQTLVVIG
jgi:hypothetical protein